MAFVKDDNGNLVQADIVPQVLTKEQLRANALYAQAAAVNPSEAMKIANAAKGNIASAGVVASIAKLNIDPQSPLAQNLSGIDAQTKAQRTANQNALAMERAKEDFNNSLRGQFWSAVKGLSRGITTAYSTPFQAFNAIYRQGVQDVRERGVLKGITRPLYSGFVKGDNYSDAFLAQTQAGQVFLNAIKGQPIKTGEGFFISEDTGVGLAARNAAKAAARIDIKDANGKPVLDKDGNALSRPRSLFSDITSYVVGGGHPDGSVASTAGLIADVVASVFLDPGTSRARAAKLLRDAEKARISAGGIAEASKVADDAAMRAEKIMSVDEKRNAFFKADAAAKTDAVEASLAKADDARLAYNGRKEEAINATKGVQYRIGQLNDSLTKNQSIKDEVTNLKQQINDATSVLKAPNQLKRAESEVIKANKALEDGKAMAASGQYPAWLAKVPELEAAAKAALDKVTQLRTTVGEGKVVDQAKIDELKVALNEARLREKYSNQEVKEMSRSVDLAKKSARLAKGAEARNLVDYANKSKSARTAEQIFNDKSITADQARAEFAAAVQDLAGLKDGVEGGIDYTKIADFLTSGHGSAAIDKLVDVKDWKQIFRMGKNRITVEQAQKIANATTKEGVLDALAPYIAKSDVQMGVFSPTLVEKMGARIAERVPLAAPFARALKGVGAAVQHRMPYHAEAAGLFEGFMSGVEQAGEILSPLGKPVAKVKKYVYDPIKQRYTTKVRGGVLLNIHDTDALVEHVDMAGRALKLDSKVIDDLLEQIATADSAARRGMIATVGFMKAVENQFAEGLSPQARKQFDEAIRVFKASNEEMSSYWATQHINGAEIGFMQAGEKIVLSGPHLESEMLNSTVYMPPTGELLKLMTRMSKRASTGVLRDVTDALIGDYWKRMQLVRPAFIIRNIAEEQLRVFGTGHISFFNSPLMATAMWLGNKNGSAFRQFLYRMDRHTHDVTGNEFASADVAADLIDETVAHEVVNSYIPMMANATGSIDERGMRVLALKNVGAVGTGHTRFWEGVTNQLRMLNSSQFARIVAGYTPKEVADALKAGMTREDAVIEYFFTGPGRKTMDEFGASHSEEVTNWLKTREGIKEYLYSGKSYIQGRTKDASVLGRITEMTGGNKLLQELVAYGKVTAGGETFKIPSAADSAANSMANAKAIKEGKKAILDAQKTLSKSLEKAFKSSVKFADDTLVNVPSVNAVTTTVGKSLANLINKASDAFFDMSTAFEKNSTMGPEFRQAYWDAIRNIAGALDGDAKTQLAAMAEKSLSPLTRKGINFGAKHPAHKAMEFATGDGPLSLEEAHIYADTYARKHVKELFYQANERRLIFHQLRLVGPFMNAWEDTITKWAKIGIENPAQVYKMARAINWLEKPESSAIYRMTDSKDYYDPNQGFFFTDPKSGQRMFWVPFAGSIMGKLAGVPANANYTSNPIAFAANPMSFNFALGAGSILPGVGPGVTIPLSVIDSFKKDFIDNMPIAVQKWLFPFGKLDTSKGPLSAVLPMNWQRIIGGFTGEDATYNNTYKPIMEYIASGGNYNLDDPEQQTELLKKADTFSRFFSIMRGVTGMFSPASLVNQGLAHDKNGDVTTQVALYNDFLEIVDQKNGDYNAAVHQFLDTYGANAVFAIISSTSGKGPDNWDAYQFVVKNPDVASKYSDVWGYIYPGGGFSSEMYRWNILNGTKQSLTKEEILTKANNLRYYAAKDGLLRMVDAGQLDKQSYGVAVQNLNRAFNGGPEIAYDPNRFGREMEQMRNLVDDPRFVDVPSVKALRDYIYMRDAALNKIGKKTNANLKGTSADVVAVRTWLSEQVSWLLKDNPDFYKMYYQFFAKELEG